MGYEDATATRLLATHCWCCGKELVDAESVEKGIGPVCRKKHGYDIPLDPEARKRANALVYEASAVFQANPARVLEIATEIEKLGLVELAEKMRDNFITIRLVEVADAPLYRWDRTTRTEVPTGEKDTILQVKVPYISNWFDVVKAHLNGCYRRHVFSTTEFSRYSGRPKYDYLEVKREDSRILLKLLATVVPGAMALGPKGVFQVPTMSEYFSKHAERRVS